MKLFNLRAFAVALFTVFFSPALSRAQSQSYNYKFGNASDNEIAYDVAIDNQGRVLLAGKTDYDPDEGSNSRGFVLRLTSTGQLDPTFAPGSPTPGVAYIDFPNSSDQVRAIALNDAGEIFLSGRTNLLQACVFKLNSDGMIVSGFGSGGRAILQAAAEFNDLIILPNQKIVAVGWGIVVSAQDADYIIARFNTNGQLDGSFGTQGGFTNVEFEDDDFAYSVDRQSDGKLLVCGESWTCSTSSCEDFSITRLLENGQIDQGYGVSGKRLFKTYPQTSSTSVWYMNLQKVDNEDRALISGIHSIDFKPFLFRLRSNGNEDASMGSFGFADYPEIPGLWGASAIQGDNKMLLTTDASNGVKILRTKVDGTVDNFGSNGVFTANLGGYATPYQIISTGNFIYVVGEIISGSTGNAFVVKITNTNVVDVNDPGTNNIGLYVYPNPSKGDISIRFRAQDSETAEVRIFDPIGRLVYSTTVETLSGEELDIPISFADRINCGRYIIQIQTSNRLECRTVVIER